MKAMKTTVAAMVAALVGASGGAWAQDRPWDGWGMHPMGGVWGLWGLAMMIVMLVFWGLVIAGLVLGIRWLLAVGRESRPGSRQDPALDILRQRYARGDISREEFEARKRDLGA
jgi:putative membrane protein